MVGLSDLELSSKTITFKARHAAGESLTDMLPEVFAVAREASRRVLGLRPFDVQLLCGLVLHDGQVAEMKTGEGKTLAATLPAYLNAIAGQGVHIVTVNDYLARRDAEWMGKVYNFLNLSVGVITSGLDDAARRAQYANDVTFVTNNELGFDYLRDHMKYSNHETVQRGLFYAIVDEVDSILIDEARTPLVISGPSGDNTALYRRVDPTIAALISDPANFESDEKSRIATFTEIGARNTEDSLRSLGIISEGGLFDPQNVEVMHHAIQALRAHVLFRRDVHYVVQHGQILLVDEFTGRMMFGRRYSDGLHQAIEAKEGVEIQAENVTLASITFQKLFRMYGKLSGMTGTAATEADEFSEIYNLGVVEIPSNRPVIRIDEDDRIFRTEKEKLNALMDLVHDCRRRNQPVLIGTTSIEKSERISEILTSVGIGHAVLNARFHDQEAEIIAQAGAPGAVTIATNMAGRGTDIRLGGKNVDARMGFSHEDTSAEYESKEAQAVRLAGGLFVVGTERHESRRIDNQLRGRSGRQGDPGRSCFLLSLEDDLLRIFGSERMASFLATLGLNSGESIIHPWVSKAVEKAQRKVEARNFDMRKGLLKYDDVIDSQRREIYSQREVMLNASDVRPIIREIIEEVVSSLYLQFVRTRDDDINLANREIVLHIDRLFAIPSADEILVHGQEFADSPTRLLLDTIEDRILCGSGANGEDETLAWQRYIMIRCLDTCWIQHLHTLELLKQGIGLRAYGQRDPLREFQAEAYSAFNGMLEKLREEICIALARSPTPVSEQLSVLPSDADATNGLTFMHTSDVKEPEGSSSGNIRMSRNSVCHCGSGLKYKHCHGRFT